MKCSAWFLTVVVLLGCAGSATAQCAGNPNPGGFDLLQTPNGSTDNLSSIGLGTVTFQGVALPSVADAGTTDTIVCRINPLTYPIPGTGETLNIQIVALLLQSTGTVICDNSLCGSYYGQPVTVYATINQTNGIIPLNQLPEPDYLTPSTGSMTVYSNDTFNTNGTTVQADLIVVPAGDAVTATAIFTTPMPTDTISASGSSWTSTAPAGYPTPPSFPPGGFYVNSFASAGVSVVRAMFTTGALKWSFYGLGLLFLGVAMLKFRSSAGNGRINLRPAYFLALAAISCFVAWRSGSFVFPLIVHAKAVCVSQGPVTVWVYENGTYVKHTVQTAGCTPQPVKTNPSQ